MVHNELTNAKDSLIRYWAPTQGRGRDEMEKRIDEAVKKQREEEGEERNGGTVEPVNFCYVTTPRVCSIRKSL